jgi:ABC-2 type transport system permease protein
MSIHRIWAMVLRHLYNFRHNLDRITDTFYWPSIDIIVWGLTISALEKQGQTSLTYVAMIVTGIVLWFILWKIQGEITVNFLEELWNENFVNLFATPLKVSEWMVSMCVIGVIKLILSFVFTSALALALHSVNILNVGIWLGPMLISLTLFGWAFGFMAAGLLLRYGTSIQTLAWAGAVVLMPFSAVYYPLEMLPRAVQIVSMFIPASYVFEGMREIILSGTIQPEKILISFALNAVYLTLAIAFFLRSFQVARKHGLAHLK